MSKTILLVDDDPMIVDVLRYQLEKEGYQVILAYDGQQALEKAREVKPDLILLDVMMPQKDGWEVCQEIRRINSVPIVMITARGEEMDRVLGLELGADDYIVKPFSFRELLARIRAIFRRVTLDQQKNYPHSDVITLENVTIDKRRRQVTRNGQPVHLSQREYDLLIALLEEQGAVVNRGDLLDKVWGETWVGDPRTLDVHICWLREKLEDDPAHPKLICTVRGVGYRLATPKELGQGS